jgi:Rieske Fe-S protein
MAENTAGASGCGASCDEHRRSALKRCAGAVIGLVAMPMGEAVADDAAAERPRIGDHLVRASDSDGASRPVAMADLKLGDPPVLVYPFDRASGTRRDGSRLNRILLLRLDPDAMDAQTRARSADGVIAFSAVCTHQGCDLSEYNPAEGVLFCFCHFTKFRPTHGGEVVSGPAPRRLPILPLKSVSGELVVADTFSARPGATV